MDCVNVALGYRNAGLCSLPVKLDTKRPALSTWKPFQQCLPHEQQIRAWFADCDGVCLVLGAVSGSALGLDFDLGGELYEAWKQAVVTQAPALFARLVIECSRSQGKHAYWRIAGPALKSQKLAERVVAAPGPEPVTIKGKTYTPVKVGDHHEVILTLIETRGEKGIMVCAPTPGYVLEQGALENLPTLTQAESDLLLETACALNEHIPAPKPIPKHECRPDVAKEPRQDGVDRAAGARPGDEFNARGDIRPVLLKHGWTLVKPGENEYWRRPGKTDGTSATLKNGVFYVFTTSAAPFDGNTPYSPFHVYTLLEHGGEFSKAAAALASEGFGSVAPSADVNLDGITGKFAAGGNEHKTPPGPPDPGPIPDELLRVPGFISEVMDHCLDTAPYPNHVMAFCGALSLQAFLAGRKVRDAAGNRTNLYLLGLAHSATGKDWPRKLNMRIAYRVGLARAVAERFASGEGLQDALYTDPCMLFQTDEIDGLFRLVNGAQDARHENIITQLLMMYSSASTVFPMRKLAKQEHGVIDQPCLVLFGTAIPNHYYDALSSRMLTNGLFARMMVLESRPRSKGKDAADTDPPPRVLAIAQWWADFAPGTGNLRDWHPVPAVVEQADDAKRFLGEAREQAEAEYAAAEAANDALATTVWGRVDEQTRKLALIYAISADHEAPRIGLPAVQWAHALVQHQTKRMLFMAKNYVAENPFDKDCLKLIRKLREAGGQLPHSDALKNMHMQAKPFIELIQTLEQRGEIQTVTDPSGVQGGRPNRVYRLVGGSQ